MRKHIFFRRKPDEDFLLRLLNCFGVTEFGQDVTFTKEDLAKIDTVGRVQQIQEELRSYYIPCKARIYVADLTAQKCITILRQILRLHNIGLFSNQRMKDGVKRVHYTVAWPDYPSRLRHRADPTTLTFN